MGEDEERPPLGSANHELQGPRRDGPRYFPILPSQMAFAPQFCARCPWVLPNGLARTVPSKD